MKSIAALLTVHNRKTKTLECLSRVSSQELPKGYELEFFLTDDGCTDGTKEAVRSQFPNVNIIEGNGNLFWNRGMYTSWEAASTAKDFDYYLWLNDDTMLFKNTLKMMLASATETDDTSIICGATKSQFTSQVTYSGKMKHDDTLIRPNGKLQECDIINGNCILVPRKVFQRVGNLDWSFKHAIGDFDYGLRAQKAGFKNYIEKDFIGTCELNPTLPKWCLKTTALSERFSNLYSPLGYAEPIPFFIYEKRHFGIATAIMHFVTINVRALLPQLWK